MQYRLVSPLIALFCTAAATVASAQQEPESAAGRTGKHRTLVGEIRQLAGTTYQVKPWDSELPESVQVTAGPATRYLELKRIKSSELAPGDAVVVALDPDDLRAAARAKAAEEGSEDGKAAKDSKSSKETREPEPIKANLILRVPREVVGEAPDRAVTLALYDGCLPYFGGARTGGLQRPKHKKDLVLGRLDSTKPLTVTVEGKPATYKTVGETVWLSYGAAPPESFKKEQTILTYSREHPASGAVQALIIGRCPRPKLEGRAKRRYDRRDRGKLPPKDDDSREDDSKVEAPKKDPPKPPGDRPSTP